MALYCRSFGFRQPYQVLVDSTFCVEVCQHKIDPAKQLATVLQGECKIMITQCSMVELYKLGQSAQHIVDVAKSFERRKCNHREAIENEPCIESVVGETNKHRYVVASQSTDLRSKLRKIPGVPLVHINRSVMVLEPRSEATIKAKDQSESANMGVTESEVRALISTAVPAPAEPKHKKKVAKGPNPLSMMKKKPKTTSESQNKHQSKSNPSTTKPEKRKRDTETSGTQNDELTVEGESQTEGGEGRHKRKRRRKHKPSGNVDVPN
ncbi:rRNA-processing protein utp23 OS=Schizosaccharomyces pombe (strain 972 / ATCC 24843) GN=utp23 PE=3 SV=1 [Rhizoctonia solani AG-1 IB]|uniref:U three protein 23 n=1 Tax=Thanatephorus cucumeris (strain AG1-IB / isolate 7/3/14) TaxID=1108050 RepID=A0A0B7FGG3_THACB|nr:rRNA-processing protein utp23 OS=Schizosaccharomyces pombe (strain 972 / ATCC 24843) GN=utp23 PE=3 SV=1 [Rhizoctonia solani AG-1 IB]